MRDGVAFKQPSNHSPISLGSCMGFTHIKPSCNTRFQPVFTACIRIFKVIMLVCANQSNFFENAKAKKSQHLYLQFQVSSVFYRSLVFYLSSATSSVFLCQSPLVSKYCVDSATLTSAMKNVSQVFSSQVSLSEQKLFQKANPFCY